MLTCRCGYRYRYVSQALKRMTHRSDRSSDESFVQDCRISCMNLRIFVVSGYGPAGSFPTAYDRRPLRDPRLSVSVSRAAQRPGRSRFPTSPDFNFSTRVTSVIRQVTWSIVATCVFESDHSQADPLEIVHALGNGGHRSSESVGGIWQNVSHANHGVIFGKFIPDDRNGLRSSNSGQFVIRRSQILVNENQGSHRRKFFPLRGFLISRECIPAHSGGIGRPGRRR